MLMFFFFFFDVRKHFHRHQEKKKGAFNLTDNTDAYLMHKMFNKRLSVPAVNNCA